MAEAPALPTPASAAHESVNHEPSATTNGNTTPEPKVAKKKKKKAKSTAPAEPAVEERQTNGTQAPIGDSAKQIKTASAPKRKSAAAATKGAQSRSLATPLNTVESISMQV